MGNILKRYNGTNWETVSGAITGDTLPIGAIVAYSSNNAPTNWLICDGSAINRVTYAELFSVIGTTYGSGDGTTTFNLPNAKGRTIVGLDSSQTEFNAMGKTGGSKYLQEHDHIIGTSMSQFANFTTVSGGDGGTPYFNENNKSGIAGTGDSGNLQPYITENIIIKAFQSAGVVANVAQTKTTSDADTYSCNYINNVLIKTGTVNGWTYEKYDNGIYKCYKNIAATGPITSSLGNFYFGITQLDTLFPVTFIETPTVNIGLDYMDWGIAQFSGVTTSKIATIIAFSTQSKSSATVIYNILVIGKWK